MNEEKQVYGARIGLYQRAIHRIVNRVGTTYFLKNVKTYQRNARTEGNIAAANHRTLFLET